MCPSILGRVETRTAILVGPALLGILLSLISGNEGFIVLIGVYLLMGVALDTTFYPRIVRWQPPWLTFVLVFGEFVILFVLAQVLDVGLTVLEAIVFFWVSWIIAITTRIVVLPIVSLGWVENASEFRETGWTVTPEYQPLPALAAAGAPQGAQPGELRLVREFSAVREIPEELRRAPAPSGVRERPPGLGAR